MRCTIATEQEPTMRQILRLFFFYFNFISYRRFMESRKNSSNLPPKPHPIPKPQPTPKPKNPIQNPISNEQKRRSDNQKNRPRQKDCIRDWLIENEIKTHQTPLLLHWNLLVPSSSLGNSEFKTLSVSEILALYDLYTFINFNKLYIGVEIQYSLNPILNNYDTGTNFTIPIFSFFVDQNSIYHVKQK